MTRGPLPPRVESLLLVLVRHELIFTGTLEDGVLAELIDTVWLPLLTANERPDSEGGRRDRLTRKVAAQPLPPAPPTSEQWIDAEVSIHQINEALAHLPANQRDVIELVCWCGLSVREAAATLRVAEGTVKSRLSRARAKLHESGLADLLEGAR